MCGILGGNNQKWNYEKGMEAIIHRGPDNQKVCRYNDFTMAFARLSILDLSNNGMQPMTHNDVTIVFNGEIYGYKKLKNLLQKKYKFYSNADTEVILYAYLEYGDNFIDKIDGMFAIALYDRRINKVKLFRDRAGIKPLYYYYNGSDFLFGSELKALVDTLEGKLKDIDYTAIYDFLYYQYIPDPKTMYKNCYKLPPAHCLVYDIISKKISINKYWKLRVNVRSEGKVDYNEIKYKVRRLISESVKEQLIADVPVGVFLSGGIDSSIVTYESSKIDPNIKTFTMSFQEMQYDEKKYADLLINKYRLNSYSQVMDYGLFSEVNRNMKVWYDEPFADTSAFPTYLVSKMAKKDVTVVLTGDGGDELFGGYDRYKYFIEQTKNKKFELPRLAQIIKHLAVTPEQNYIYKNYIMEIIDEYKPLIFMSKENATITLRKKWGIDKDYDNMWFIRKYYHKELPPITRLRYVDFKTYLPGDVLTKVDRASMVNSLETRVPFLNRKIIEYAFSLPENVVSEKDNLKKILKNAYNDVIPEEILYHKKKGFSTPREYMRSARRGIPVTIDVLSQWNV